MEDASEAEPTLDKGPGAFDTGGCGSSALDSRAFSSIPASSLYPSAFLAQPDPYGRELPRENMLCCRPETVRSSSVTSPSATSPPSSGSPARDRGTYVAEASSEIDESRRTWSSSWSALLGSRRRRRGCATKRAGEGEGTSGPCGDSDALGVSSEITGS